MTTIAVLRELRPREQRVAIVPAEVPRLARLGLDTVLEAGAGSAAGYPDPSYAEKGCAIAPDPESALGRADLVALVGPPQVAQAAGMRAGTTVLSMLPPAWCLEVIEQLRVREVTAFSFDLVPRVSRAQAMDALSSQAGIAGYEAVIWATNRLARVFPMMMTAAGTVPPAKVLVIGAGVAGLQAIATARRLGASVSGYDVRPEAADEIRSLGATAIELPLAGREGSGGYAAEQSSDFTSRQQELLANAVAASDVVITTAAVPGRPAPRLVSAEMVDSMRPGSVIVDVAAPSGGNCELTLDGSEVERSGVLVIGAGDLPSAAPGTASTLYARNVSSLLGLIVREGQVAPDFEDEVVAASCVTRGGQITHEPTRLLTEGASR